jgi:hypothetical protein
MTEIELTAEQRQALQAEQGKPVAVVDPATQQRYVLLAREEYERLHARLGSTAESETRPAEGPVIAPGILRSQQAYRRELPELLTRKKWLGQWVCYRGDERVSIARSKAILMRECLKRGWNDDEFIISVIRPEGLIEEEELPPLDPSHMMEEEEGIPPNPS